jgi:hypothetical protein
MEHEDSRHLTAQPLHARSRRHLDRDGRLSSQHPASLPARPTRSIPPRYLRRLRQYHRGHDRSPATLLYGHADPIDEPVIAHGRFVMTTREEIGEAIRDYQAGLFGPAPTI